MLAHLTSSTCFKIFLHYSVYFSGDTVVLVSVNGPLDINMTKQSIERATLEVLYLSKGGKPSISDRYKENVIKQTCEAAIMGSLHPRTGITVTIQEMEDCGGVSNKKCWW